MTLTELLKALADILWGPAMILLLVGTGLYLTIRLRAVQVLRFGHSIRCISGKYDRPQEQGDVTHFQALAAALSATIGTGNIAGVATAIAFGGPGAIFWMWITAVVGMATKFTSCSLALRFREIHADGSASGGPMHFLEKGFRPHGLVRFAGDERTRRWGTALGVAFAFFAMVASFGIGNMVQAHSVVDGLKTIIPEKYLDPGLNVNLGRVAGVVRLNYFSLGVGLLIAVMVGLVIIGGIRRIARVACKIVPIMSVVYLVGAVAVLVLNVDRVPTAIGSIFHFAFQPLAAGGGFMGAVVAHTMRYGVARGVFSNESGLGSAPIAHAAAKTHEMAREGFVAMLGPFIDTILICTMTALVILTTDVWQVRDAAGRTVCGIGSPNSYSEVDDDLVVVDPEGETVVDAEGEPYALPGSSALTARSFEAGFRHGRYIVAFGLVFFAYSTMISWSYYGDRCAEFLFGPGAIIPYRCVYVALIVVGASGGLRTIWALADVFNALMAIPNLLGLLALGGVVAHETRAYLKRLDAGEF